MSFVHSMTIAFMATLPLASMAQEKFNRPDPSNPDATVPAATYASALGNYRAFNAPKESPAKVWRAVNDEIGQIGDGMGQMSDAPAPPTSAPDAATPAATPATPSPEPKPMPTDHSMHHPTKGK